MSKLKLEINIFFKDAEVPIINKRACKSQHYLQFDEEVSNEMQEEMFTIAMNVHGTNAIVQFLGHNSVLESNSWSLGKHCIHYIVVF